MGKQRTCETCAWSTKAEFYPNVLCHHDRACIEHLNTWWCRHHSFTRGWSSDIPHGDIRHGMFAAVTSDELELLTQINKAWEEYTKLLKDWYLMKDK